MLIIPQLQYFTDEIFRSYCSVNICRYLKVLVQSDPENNRDSILSNKEYIKNVFYLLKTPIIEHQELMKNDLEEILKGYDYDEKSYEVILHIFHYSLKYSIYSILNDVANSMKKKSNIKSDFFTSKLREDSKSTVMDKLITLIRSDYINNLSTSPTIDERFLTDLSLFYLTMLTRVLRNDATFEIQQKLFKEVLKDLLILLLYNSASEADGIICDCLFVLVFNCKSLRITLWESGNFAFVKMLNNIVASKDETALCKSLHLLFELSDIPYLQHALYESGILYAVLSSFKFITKLETLILAFRVLNNILSQPIVTSYFLTYFFGCFREYINKYYGIQQITSELIKMCEILLPSPLIASNYMNISKEYVQLLINGITHSSRHVQARTRTYLQKILVGLNSLYILFILVS